MKVTIVIATYNAGQFLQQCLDSCFRQTWRQLEVIVIDGGSTDETLKIIKANQNRIAYWLSERDRGIYDAWNKALVRVTGEWILFRGADDLFWDDDVIERCASELKTAAAHIGLVYGKVAIVDANDHLQRLAGAPWPETKRRLQHEMSIPHPGTFHRAMAILECGNFDVTFRISGDYDMMLRMARRYEAMFLEDVIVSKMVEVGVSTRLRQRSRLESIRARRKNGISGLPWVLWWRILQNTKSTVLHSACHFVLGSDRYELVLQRRKARKSARLRRAT